MRLGVSLFCPLCACRYSCSCCLPLRFQSTPHLFAGMLVLVLVIVGAGIGGNGAASRRVTNVQVADGNGDIVAAFAGGSTASGWLASIISRVVFGRAVHSRARCGPRFGSGLIMTATAAGNSSSPSSAKYDTGGR